MKIICIGRNYAKHIKELNNEDLGEPVIFMKPDSAILRQIDSFYIPDWTQNVQHEVEVVIKINRIGKRIESRFAHKYFAQFTLGLDLTARDIQTELKAKGLPWEKAKAFDHSAVLGDWQDVKEVDLSNLEFGLKKNGEWVQKGNTNTMLYPINKLIEECSKYFTLKIGDLIFTGTPAGVSKIDQGDLLEGFIGEQKVLELEVK